MTVTTTTLVEIVVVVTIMAVMAGMLIPRLPDIGQRRLKSSARRLAGSITYLYERSATSGLVYRLTLDLGEKDYYVSLLNTDNQFEKTDLHLAKETFLPDGIKISRARTASQGVVSKGKAVIHFFPSGFTDISVINLKDDNSNEMTLIVHPLTGKVKIMEGAHDIETRRS